jgi:hypothetical protein
MGIYTNEIYETIIQLIQSYLILYHDYHHGKTNNSFRYDKASNTWVYTEPTTEVTPNHDEKASSLLSNDQHEADNCEIRKEFMRKNKEATMQRRLKLVPMLSKQAEEWGFFTNPYFDKFLSLKVNCGQITMEEYQLHLQSWRLYKKETKAMQDQETKYNSMPPRRLTPLKNRIRRVNPNQKVTPTPRVLPKLFFCPSALAAINSRRSMVVAPPMSRAKLVSRRRAKTTATKPPLHPKKSLSRKRPAIEVETVREEDC